MLSDAVSPGQNCVSKGKHSHYFIVSPRRGSSQGAHESVSYQLYHVSSQYRKDSPSGHPIKHSVISDMLRKKLFDNKIENNLSLGLNFKIKETST
jgi:hypothetical protein